MHRHIYLLTLLAIAGCSPDYPMDKPGTWHINETSANDANLRIMAVNQQDLVAGTGETNSLGSEAGPPVHRLLTGRRSPLPAVNALQFNNIAQPASPASPEKPDAGE